MEVASYIGVGPINGWIRQLPSDSILPMTIIGNIGITVSEALKAPCKAESL